MFLHLQRHLQGELFMYAQKYCYIFWLHRFANFIWKLQNRCSHWRWGNKSRDMSEKKVIINRRILLYMCILLCIEDIIYETIHGMESFKFTRSLSFIRQAHCSDSTAFHKLSHFSFPCPSTARISLLLRTSCGTSAFWYTRFFTAPQITTVKYILVHLIVLFTTNKSTARFSNQFHILGFTGRYF